jgi:hypothetical protein
MPKYSIVFICFIVLFIGLCAQDTLEEIVTWEVNEGEQFRCRNLNSGGSDLNNDGYDDFIHWYPTSPYKFQFYMGSSSPSDTFDFEVEVPFGSGSISWGGDLNNDGYKDIVYTVCTAAYDPGDIYICYGGEDEIDLEPDLILQGEDYVPDPYNLNYKGFNGGHDFNNDGYDDLLTWGSGPSLWWNGLVQIFLGGEELSTTPDFQIQGNIEDEFGRSRAVGDINGDGYDDLIVSRNETMSGPVFFEVYLGGETIDTNPDFITSESYNILPNWKADYAKGDVNGDGYDDLLIYHVGIFLGNQNGTINLDFPLSGYFEYLNINNDNYEDILYYNSGILNILYGSDSFDTNPDITINANMYFCNLGDFNNDGQDEILLNDGQHPEIINSATMYGLPGGNDNENNEVGLPTLHLTNYPNPFNPSTTISYKLPANVANPIIEIFNIKGERIRELKIKNLSATVDSQCKVGTSTWDGTDQAQNKVSSGVYLYRIKSDEGVLISKKMLLLK